MLDKKQFYAQLKNTRKGIPIYISMYINEKSKYLINLCEYRITTQPEKISKDFYLQIIDTSKKGYEKYMCRDIQVDLIAQNIDSDYKLYKFIDKKLQEILKKVEEK